LEEHWISATAVARPTFIRLNAIRCHDGFVIQGYVCTRW